MNNSALYVQKNAPNTLFDLRSDVIVCEANFNRDLSIKYLGLTLPVGSSCQLEHSGPTYQHNNVSGNYYLYSCSLVIQL